jgi:hypothetical protein
MHRPAVLVVGTCPSPKIENKKNDNKMTMKTKVKSTWSENNCNDLNHNIMDLKLMGGSGVVDFQWNHGSQANGGQVKCVGV